MGWTSVESTRPAAQPPKGLRLSARILDGAGHAMTIGTPAHPRQFDGYATRTVLNPRISTVGVLSLPYPTK